MILLVNPDTGDVASIKWGDDRKREIFESLVLDGWEPVGPQCKEAAERVRARAANKAPA